jgi:hypothetical protein
MVKKIYLKILQKQLEFNKKNITIKVMKKYQKTFL